LYDAHGISTVIVAGSSGAYFHIADHIIQMERYVPRDITALAKREAEAFPINSAPPEPAGALAGIFADRRRRWYGVQTPDVRLPSGASAQHPYSF